MSPSRRTPRPAHRGTHPRVVLKVVLAFVTMIVVLAGCGDASSPHARAPRTSMSSTNAADLEPATVPGLAAAVLSHLDPARAHPRGGNQNKDEKWMAVEFEVAATDRGAVPVNVMVVETPRDADPSELRRCPTGKTVLRCRVARAPDGSRVRVVASTEDPVGGISTEGFFLFVTQARDDQMVLVIEALPSRDEHYLDAKRLPVELEVLTAIASDHRVGLRTTPELNEAGEDLEGFAEPSKSPTGSPDVQSSKPHPGSESGAAFGIDRVTWPGDLQGAKALFDRMPPTLTGAERRRPHLFKSAAGVMYGRGERAPVAWVMEAGGEVPDAPSALAAMFGMSYGCAKGTYRGTAPASPYGGGPDLDHSGRYTRGGDPWWFACRIDGAEGNRNFTGYAVGWASGDLAWLTIAPDRKSTHAVLHALLAARR